MLTVAFGVGLIWLSRSLARRRLRAWQLAVAVVVASAAAHLAKGLDFEEAAISLLLLAALLKWRGRFDVPGDPASVRPLLGLGAALAGIAAVSGRGRAARHRAVASHRRRPPRPRRRLRLRRPLLLSAAVRPRRRTDGGRAADGAGARGRLRQRQPLVLRAATRQELSLLAVAPCFPRLPGRRGNCARQRRSRRRRGGDR